MFKNFIRNCDLNKLLVSHYMTSLFSCFYKFYIKNKICVGWDGSWNSIFAISQVRRYYKRIECSLSHQLKSLGPSFHNLIQPECGGFATLQGAVEDCSIKESACVMNCNLISRFRLCTFTLSLYHIL